MEPEREILFNMLCKLCQKDFKSLSGLHTHLSKSHRCSQSEYHHLFFPRYDLNTKELIHYKDHKHYYNADFNSRESFSEWLANNYKETATKEYCIQKVRERMTRKLITTLPSHVCLKSLLLPSIHGFERLYGTMQQFTESMSREKINLPFDYLTTPVLTDGPMKIFQDTREQRPLEFANSTTMKLSVGDYTPDKEFYSDVYVDRKSLADLAGTLTAGRERVEKEIKLAQDLGFYLVFVVEDAYSEALFYSANNSFSRKLTGAHIFHEIRELMATYSNIQFLFAGSRKRAASVIENIFRLKQQAKLIDLEFAKDRGLI